MWELVGIAESAVQIVSYLLLLASMHWTMPVVLIMAGVPEIVYGVFAEKRQYELDEQTMQDSRKADYLVQLTTQREARPEIEIFSLADYLKTKWQILDQNYVVRQAELNVRKNRSQSATSMLKLLSKGSVVVIAVMYCHRGLLSVGGLVASVEAVDGVQGSFTGLNVTIKHIYSYLLRFLKDLFNLLEYP